MKQKIQKGRRKIVRRAAPVKQEIVRRPISLPIAPLPDTIQSKLVLGGDLSGLNPDERVQYVIALDRRLGLDPATQPLKLIELDGKLVVYADRSCCQQLNRLHRISHQILARKTEDGLHKVECKATSHDGRSTVNVGIVPVLEPDRIKVWNPQARTKTWTTNPKAGQALKGEALATAQMKAETKAKRRSTLDLVGLGLLDETEIDAVRGAEIHAQPSSDAGQVLGTLGIAQPDAPAETQHHPDEKIVSGGEPSVMCDREKEPQRFIAEYCKACGITQEFAVKIYREAKLVESCVTFVGDIPDGTAKTLAKEEWLRKLLKRWNDSPEKAAHLAEVEHQKKMEGKK